MKISPRAPSLPPLSDVARIPASPAPGVPAPVPNVSSSFAPAPGVERRFSARFLQSLPHRLALAGLAPRHVDELLRRFSSLGRSALDREGRVVDAILASSHPREGMALYDLFARVGSAVTSGGFRVEPNHEKTWTVTPPTGDPFVFGHGEPRLTLPDGTALAHEGAATLLVGDQRVVRELAERAARLGVGTATTTLSIVATVASGGAAPPLPAVGAALGLFRAELERLDALVGSRVDPAAFTATVLGALTVVGDVGGAARELLDVLDSASRCAAPSRRNDPDAERAALLIAIGASVQALREPDTRQAALDEVRTFGDRIRGCSRTEALAQLQAALQRQTKTLETIASVSKRANATAEGLLSNVR